MIATLASLPLLLTLVLPGIFAPPLAGPGSEDPVTYGDYFLDKALRLDIHHVGTSDKELICIDELKEEAVYAGPRTHLTESLNLGSYRCELRDAASSRLIFVMEYSGLFNEWRTIEEARQGAWRAIEHSLVLPYPRAPVIVAISRRIAQGGWDELLKQTLSMEKRFIRRDNPFQGLKCKPIMVNGEPAEKVDLLFLGDGYTSKEMGRFDKDVKTAFKNVFDEEPYKKRRKDFNVWSIQCPSADSGVDQPRHIDRSEREGDAFKRTALDVSFNFFDLPRYALTDEIHTLYDVAAHAPHDIIVVLFNAKRMGGGGIFNLYAVSSAGSDLATKVLIHELGHGLGGLADEYYTSDVSYIEFYPSGTEPCEPNITALLDPEKVKWQHLIRKGTPVPTPRDAKYRSVVGCFEGAGYKEKGLYRPCLDCAMFSLNTCRYCPVCLEAMERAIDFYAR
jgi:hypothetical protein